MELGIQRPNTVTPEEEARLRGIREERDALYASSREAREAWGRSTSIILIIFATLVMAVSLVRSDQLPVISNGLLLGGVFTMVYGVGWIVASNTSLARFVVVTIAFAITLALGYIRFVRRGAEGGRTVGRLGHSGSSTGSVDTQEISDLQERVLALEQRLEAAGRAFEGR
jgi:hypothetical protein